MEIKMYQGLLELNWNVLFSFITVLVLYLILRKFLFQKVRNFMQDREKGIADSLQHAEDVNREADEKLAVYNEKIDGIEKERREIILDGRRQAQVQADQIIADANREAQEEREKAKKEIAFQQKRSEEKFRDEMSDLVMLAAKKALGGTLDDDTQQAMIRRALEEAGEGDGE